MNLRKILIVLISVPLILFFVFTGKPAINYIKYELYPKNDLQIQFGLLNMRTISVSADSSNLIYLKAEVRDSAGIPVPMAHVEISLNKNVGKITRWQGRTGQNGELIISYTPPDLNSDQLASESGDITITAGIYRTVKTSSVYIPFSRVPVVFIPGYREDPEVYNNLNEYLLSLGYPGEIFVYKTENGIASASKDLGSHLRQQKTEMLSKGIQVNRFDVIAHSMGGLVARYYSCSSEYGAYGNIRKLIFLSVPHKGSPWASVGIKYFNDQGMLDLFPDSEIFSKQFPSLLNKGLNYSVETGNIIAQYDEVISLESVSLEVWNIKTEVFNVGGKSFSVDSLLSGNIFDAPNHKSILNNKKVFERITEMLNTRLTFPKKLDTK